MDNISSSPATGDFLDRYYRYKSAATLIPHDAVLT